ncbi:hypothetical protein [Priestia megaterium]|uniref:hypothetical protein n=1 Tax=Priestia megaterium TaxID=1404 RepID=UPI000BF75A23|nr:hypothetical protein [Priestia megaterium]PFR91116.1 hypothetical protein COK39_24125 [Priestia megaterium]
MGEEKTIHDIEVPMGINLRQVTIAQDYVTSRLQEGFTVSGFCTKHNLSTKSWYQWLNNDVYNKYINEMSDVILPADELEAVRKMKKKIMGFADKPNVSVSELKIFSDTFSYVFEAEARLQIEKLGLNQKNQPKEEKQKTVEEMKAYLLGKLYKGGN